MNRKVTAKTIGKKVTQAVGDRALCDVAEEAGITRAQLWNIRNGHSLPSVGTLLALAAVLKVPVCSFLQP